MTDNPHIYCLEESKFGCLCVGGDISEQHRPLGVQLKRNPS